MAVRVEPGRVRGPSGAKPPAGKTDARRTHRRGTFVVRDTCPGREPRLGMHPCRPGGRGRNVRKGHWDGRQWSAGSLMRRPETSRSGMPM
jgi:hypothetical protein